MRHTILFYLVGLATALLGSTPTHYAPLVLCAALVLWWLSAARYAAAVLYGLLWGGWHVEAYLAERAAVSARGELMHLAGSVASFPLSRGGRVMFEVETAQARPAWAPPAPAARVRVWTQAGMAPNPGMWCELRVRVRRAHALANARSRDAERGYAAARIIAFASVIDHPANLCLAIAPRYAPQRLRARLSRRIDEQLGVPAASALRALVVADRSALDEPSWARVRATGTSHLLAISGLHISLAAGWAMFATRVLVATAGSARQRYAAARAGWLAAALAALLYAALAGFGIPATRAACMVVVAALAALGGRRALSVDNVLLALGAITLWDPFALLGNGLWLSFAAVVILIALTHGERGERHWLRQAWRTHCALALGLSPLVAVLFGELPLLAPLANLIAVPWCSLLIVPLALAGALASIGGVALSSVLWGMAARLWTVLEVVLDGFVALDLSVPLAGLIDPDRLAALLFGVVLLAAPRALKLRGLGVVVLTLSLAVRAARPAPGALELHLFDVGQGLALVVRTRHHSLLYDTGPAWRGRVGGAGSAVVVPGLRGAGVRQLDALVISHADSDHAGGFAAVRSALEPRRTYAPAASTLAGPYAACTAGRSWRWDGVDFRWLHPPPNGHGSRNDQSCVLHISSPYGRVLLSGDIESGAERALLERHGRGLAAEVLVVPHHGSRTSSGAAFVRAVAPRYALIGAGFGNRYGLPHAEVLARYHAIGTRVINTAESGAVDVRLSAHGITLAAERARRHGFWTGAGLTTP